MKTSKGFTLIELVIVTVLISILSTLAARIISQTYKNYSTGKKILQLGNTVNIAINNALSELSQAERFNAIGPNSVSFVNQNGDTVVMDVSGGVLRRSLNAGTAWTLCDNVINDVTNFTFAYYNQSFASTATPASVSFMTMKILANDGLPYSLMGGTVIWKALPNN